MEHNGRLSLLKSSSGGSALVEDNLLREVEALYFDYASMVDEEILLWPDLFAETATYRAMSRSMGKKNLPQLAIVCEGRREIVELAMAIRETTAYLDRVMRHTTTQIRISYRDDQVLKTMATFAIYETTESASRLFAVGQYQDTIVRIDGYLCFREKRCIYDGNLALNPIIYPL